MKVSQYSCDDSYIAAQAGCFQYHTGLTGTLQSYNYAGAAQIQGHNYKNCIRAEVGMCCIEYSVVSSTTFKINAIACAAADPTPTPAISCAGASTCGSDYIIIPK